MRLTPLKKNVTQENPPQHVLVAHEFQSDIKTQAEFPFVIEVPLLCILHPAYFKTHYVSPTNQSHWNPSLDLYAQ